ncbi:MAG TPA: hypothetical protein DDW49_02520 [Deltaproteobacteria bacterium]|nr:hypothetical protein [Deltaproteobacteria bacterium]
MRCLLPHAFDRFTSNIESRVLTDGGHNIVDENIGGIGLLVEDASLLVEVHFNFSFLIKFLDNFFIAMVASQPIGFLYHHRQSFSFWIFIDKGQNLVELFPLCLLARCLLKRIISNNIGAL